MNFTFSELRGQILQLQIFYEQMRKCKLTTNQAMTEYNYRIIKIGILVNDGPNLLKVCVPSSIQLAVKVFSFSVTCIGWCSAYTYI